MLGEFNKEEADSVMEALREVFQAIPKTRQGRYAGQLNSIFLFLENAKRVAPQEARTSDPSRSGTTRETSQRT